MSVAEAEVGVIDRDGRQIAWTATGTGPPLALIPGFLMSSAWWDREGYIDQLRPHHRTILIDPLGFGASSRPHDARAYAAASLASDLEAVLDACGADRAAVWGFSRGGGLAADFAELHPDRCAALIVGGATIAISGPDLLPLQAPRRDALRAGDWDGAWETLASVLPVHRKQEIVASNDPLAAAAASEGPLDRVRDIDQIACPTLIYAGSDDWSCPLAASDAARMGARFVAFEGLDHRALFAAAGPVSAEALAFLRSAGSWS